MGCEEVKSKMEFYKLKKQIKKLKNSCKESKLESLLAYFEENNHNSEIIRFNFSRIEIDFFIKQNLKCKKFFKDLSLISILDSSNTLNGVPMFDKYKKMFKNVFEIKFNDLKELKTKENELSQLFKFIDENETFIVHCSAGEYRSLNVSLFIEYVKSDETLEEFKDHYLFDKIESTDIFEYLLNNYNKYKENKKS